jgi:hypothetical protein
MHMTKIGQKCQKLDILSVEMSILAFSHAKKFDEFLEGLKFQKFQNLQKYWVIIKFLFLQNNQILIKNLIISSVHRDLLRTPKLNLQNCFHRHIDKGESSVGQLIIDILIHFL